MLVLGVTGDVGAGKSTVSQIWKSLGATIIDADALAHEAGKTPQCFVGQVSVGEPRSFWKWPYKSVGGASIAFRYDGV